MGATSSKEKNAKSQSKSTATASDVHQTITSNYRASPSCKSDNGKERRPSLTRESSGLTRSTVTSSSKVVDGTTRSRRASIQPRTSTIMEEPPEIGTSRKTKASSGSRSIFMCCVATAA